MLNPRLRPALLTGRKGKGRRHQGPAQGRRQELPPAPGGRRRKDAPEAGASTLVLRSSSSSRVLSSHPPSRRLTPGRRTRQEGGRGRQSQVDSRLCLAPRHRRRRSLPSSHSRTRNPKDLLLPPPSFSPPPRRSSCRYHQQNTSHVRPLSRARERESEREGEREREAAKRGPRIRKGHDNQQKRLVHCARLGTTVPARNTSQHLPLTPAPSPTKRSSPTHGP